MFTTDSADRSHLSSLYDAIEAIGGRVVHDERCVSEALPAVPHLGVEEAFTCGCGGATALLDYPMESSDHDGGVAEKGEIKFCPLCDAGRRWPRVAEAMPEERVGW